jgi:hypothetical protein
MKWKYVIILFFWLALMNWPLVLMLIPLPRLPCLFMPFLLWINIPALWLGLAKTIGQPHYDIQEFGALPQTPLAWILIAAFWSLLAIGITVVIAATVELPRLLRKRLEKKKASNNVIS